MVASFVAVRVQVMLALYFDFGEFLLYFQVVFFTLDLALFGPFGLTDQQQQTLFHISC